MKQLASLKGMHAKQWEEFLQLDAQRRQQQSHQQLSSSAFGGYTQHGYSEYDTNLADHHYGANLALDSRGRYPDPISRPHDKFGDFQRSRRENYGKPYNRY